MYLERFVLPIEKEEDMIRARMAHNGGKYGYIDNIYPCGLFSKKLLYEINFDTVTILYGGNGSGKSTLLNLIASKLQLDRIAPFNSSELYSAYVSECKYELGYDEERVQHKIPEGSRIITSDDVFDYMLTVRTNNVDIAENIEVASADTPEGPFHDALGRPMLEESFTSTLQYDPTVFVDPDTDIHYLIWGCCEGDGYFIARLNEDMVSLAEEPRQIMIGEAYARDDKSFLHKKNGIYYLSWGSFYATSENVYGPYTYRGNLEISEDHGSFFSWNGQDFFAYTIFDPNNYYRATGICYIHYKENGEMTADQIIAEYGVGHYDSEWNKIQAEWYMHAKSVKKKENVWGGFDIGDINEKSELYYPNICGMKNKTKVHFLVASMEEDACIEVWDNEADRRIGVCKVNYTGRYDHCGYQVCSCDLDRDIFLDKLNMKLLFKGNGKEIMRIHWFKFT